MRARSYGWNTITVKDGNLNLEAMNGAIATAKNHTGSPTLISLKTIIGYGSTKEVTKIVVVAFRGTYQTKIQIMGIRSPILCHNLEN